MKSQDKSLDHMEPLSLGGWHSIDNVMVCCLRCNVKKNAMPYAEWLERIPEPCQRKLTERAA
jgi:5-methylcytosine-specific restriction endonuclease McrA